MGAKREVIGRAARRVGLSSAGEVVGRAVNLTLPFAIFAIHSVDAVTDSFFMALAITFFFQGTLANSLVNTLVPEIIKNSEKLALRSFMLWTLASAISAAVIVSALAMKLFLPGQVILIAISVFLMAGSGVGSAPAAAALYSDHQYALPGLTWGLRIIPLIFYLLWHPETPALHLLLAGLALADTARFVVLHSAARGRFTVQKEAPSLHLPPSALHLIIASAISGMTPLIARWIISYGEAGSISIFEAADRIYSAIASLATIGMGNVMLVYLSRLTYTPEERDGWRLMLRAAFYWSLSWLVLSILVWLAFPWLVSWIQLQSETVVTEVRHTFLALSLGIPGFIMTIVLSRRILALGLSHSLIAMALIGLILNTITGKVLFSLMSTSGIALALSGGQYLVAWMMYLRLRKR